MAPLKITYTLHPPQSPLLHQALKGIRAQLPLRNLHWKSASRTSLRTIQEVDVQFLELGELGGGSRDVAGSVLDASLVNVVLVACEDAEMYKNSTKSFIRDWLSLLAARRNVHAPLIILVNPPAPDGAAAGAKSGKNVFGRDTGIIAKLRSDFNTTKRDRCAQVTLPSQDITDPAAWPEVINKLKESVVTAFDGAIHDREEEVKRGEGQRTTVGWNFCNWFSLKESLAASFEGMNLYEDALVVYEELEASFFQVLKEQNLSWFGKLGASQPRDDSLPVLDTRVRPYRDLLQASSISIFEFRVYVFARQAALLGHLGRITEIAKRGQWFVSSLTRRLRESEADLAEHFIESWTYSACMEIVTRCDEWSVIDRPNGDYSGLIAYESARAELLDIARIQVERIGVASGHLPDIYPFAHSTSIGPTTDDVLFESSSVGSKDEDDTAVKGADSNDGRPSISNRQLLDAMADVTRFRSLYLSLTKKAIMAYEACGKINSVIRLKADLAGLALYTEEWSAAFDLCRALARDCAEHRTWDPVAKYALEGALRAHEKLSKERDQEWADLALAYLRSVAVLSKLATASGQEQESVEEQSGLVVSGLRGIAEKQEAHEHPAFAVRLLSREAENKGDLTTVSAEVTNNLPMAVDLDEVRLEFEDEVNGHIVFSAEGIKTVLGTAELKLSCSSGVAGAFRLTQSTLRLGSVSLTYPPPDGESLIRVRRSPSGPEVALRMPYNISLDSEPRVALDIAANAAGMANAEITLYSLQHDVIFHLDAAACDTNDVIPAGNAILLGDIAAGETISLTIPYSGTAPSDTIQARMKLSYTADDETPREWRDVQELFMGLPLTVNVQDVFRPDCLLSHFTIASDGKEYLRVRGVELSNDPSSSFVELESCTTGKRDIVVAPDRPLSALFKIKRRPGTSTVGTEVLRLVIEYCNIREGKWSHIHRLGSAYRAEIRSVADEAVQRVDDSARSRLATRRMLEASSDWLPAYASIGQLPTVDGLEWPTEEEVFARSRIWRKLEIPVDVPHRRLLASVRLSRQNEKAPVFEGHAVAVTASIRVSSAWAAEPVEGKQKLVYDLQAAQDDWIILGRKKGFFLAEPNSVESVQLMLVPTRAGTLALPSMTVQIVPSSMPRGRSDDEDTLCETFVENAAEAIRVLPVKKEVTALVPVRSVWHHDEVEVR